MSDPKKFPPLIAAPVDVPVVARVGFLGPKGTFSHIATLAHFGVGVELIELPNIESVFEMVDRGLCSHGVVPYENAIGGSIVETLDAFQERSTSICGETLVVVNHCVLSKGSLDEIVRIFSRGEVFAQCRKWLAQRFPNTPLIAVSSTAAAAEEAARDSSSAAIASTVAGSMFGLSAHFQDIEDRPNNITRFLILGADIAPPSGNDRTTIMFATANRPGALVDVLDSFRRHGVNLSHIEKRPSGRENWTYTFFVDADAHQMDDSLKNALNTAREHVSTLQVLGSYPAAQRPL